MVDKQLSNNSLIPLFKAGNSTNTTVVLLNRITHIHIFCNISRITNFWNIWRVYSGNYHLGFCRNRMRLSFRMWLNLIQFSVVWCIITQHFHGLQLLKCPILNSVVLVFYQLLNANQRYCGFVLILNCEHQLQYRSRISPDYIF